MLEWKEKIGLLSYLNKLRLQAMRDEAEQEVTRVRNDNIDAGRKQSSLVGVKGSAEKQPVKVYRSLLNHRDDLTLFMQYPQIPLDNNIAENSIRGPVNGRKGYYGSGSIWSAELAAMLFSILQTLALWGINPRHWLSRYLNACAKNGGKAPQDIQPFIPWQMGEQRRHRFSGPQLL